MSDLKLVPMQSPRAYPKARQVIGALLNAVTKDVHAVAVYMSTLMQIHSARYSEASASGLPTDVMLNQVRLLEAGDKDFEQVQEMLLALNADTDFKFFTDIRVGGQKRWGFVLKDEEDVKMHGNAICLNASLADALEDNKVCWRILLLPKFNLF